MVEHNAHSFIRPPGLYGLTCFVFLPVMAVTYCLLVEFGAQLQQRWDRWRGVR